jgi:hypothetical protein
MRSRWLRALFALLALASLGLVACGGDDDDRGADASSGDQASGSSDASDDIDEECIEDLVGKGFTEALTNTSDVDDLSQAFDEFADGAPNEIKQDVRTIADAFDDYLAALDDAGVDPKDPKSFADADPEKLEKIGEALDDDEFTKASERVSAYFEEHCD